MPEKLPATERVPLASVGRQAAEDPLRGAAHVRLWTGLKAGLAGFGWVLRDRRLAAWTFVAVLAYVALWSAALYAAASWDDRLVAAIMWPRGTSWWESAAYEIVHAVAYVVFWVAVLVLTFVVALPAVSPLFAFVAEATENAYYADPIAHASSKLELLIELLKSVVRSLALVAVHVSGSAVIWGVSLLVGLLFPPAATAISIVIGGTWSALWIGVASASYVLENNRTPLGEQLKLVAEAPVLLLGFGAVAQVLTWLPLTAPIAVVSSTILLCQLNENGRCGLPLRDAHQRKASASPPA